jgi:uncharacterized protein RhaS with RHS repeats
LEAEPASGQSVQRYYDPQCGCFLSVDPVTALNGSFNRYWYANSNPYRFIDPDGRNACGTNDDSTCKVEIKLESRTKDKSGSFNDEFTKTKNSKNYNAVATIYINGKEAGRFLARTIPSDKKFATVANGGYSGNSTTHKRTYPAIAFEANGKVPTVGKNPAHPDQNYATAIQIHKAGVNNFTGITRAGGGVSEGCTLIATDQYSEFLTTTGVTPVAGTPQSTFRINMSTDEND